MNHNIVLIGMPASGKTTIGTKLSEILKDYTFIDTDSFIEKTEGLKITEIFAKYSEDYFRKLEYDAIKLLCTGKNKIISIGGGAFENPDNRATLLKFGRVFYLKSDLDVLYYRISGDSSRPLLQTNNPRETLEKILAKREENYLKAHHVLNTSNLELEDIIKMILGSIDETNS